MYMSFADEEFRGAAIIRSKGPVHAMLQTHALGINPGGEIQMVTMPEDIIAQVPERFRNRLLSKADILEVWPDAKSIGEFEEEERKQSN